MAVLPYSVCISINPRHNNPHAQDSGREHFKPLGCATLVMKTKVHFLAGGRFTVAVGLFKCTMNVVTVYSVQVWTIDILLSFYFIMDYRRLSTTLRNANSNLENHPSCRLTPAVVKDAPVCSTPTQPKALFIVSIKTHRTK